MRAATSSADQFCARSRATASSAPMKEPSGLAQRGQMWPLSIWVCMSTKQGQTMPPARSWRGRVAGWPGGSRRSTSPSAIMMSATQRPSPSASQARRIDERRRQRGIRQDEAAFLRHRSEAAHQFSRFTALSCHRRNRRCEIRLVAKKIRMPVKERSTSAANRRGMLSRYCDSRSRKARPEPAPAEPAANSATTAAISARPPAIRRPARK